MKLPTAQEWRERSRKNPERAAVGVACRTCWRPEHTEGDEFVDPRFCQCGTSHPADEAPRAHGLETINFNRRGYKRIEG